MGFSVENVVPFVVMLSIAIVAIVMLLNGTLARRPMNRFLYWTLIVAFFPLSLVVLLVESWIESIETNAKKRQTHRFHAMILERMNARHTVERERDNVETRMLESEITHSESDLNKRLEYEFALRARDVREHGTSFPVESREIEYDDVREHRAGLD